MESLFRRAFPLLVVGAAVFAAVGVLFSVVFRSDSAGAGGDLVELLLTATLLVSLVLLAYWRSEPTRRRVLATAFVGLASAAGLYGAGVPTAVAARLSLLVAAILLLVMCVVITAVRADQPRRTPASRW